MKKNLTVSIKKSNKRLFEEVVNHFKKHAFVGEIENKVFSEKIYKKLISKNFKISAKQVTSFLSGKVPKKDEKLFKKIVSKVKKTVPDSRMYFQNEKRKQPKTRMRRLKRGEVYYFKTGLNLFFLNNKKGENEFFEIPNFPIAEYLSGGFQKMQNDFDTYINERLGEFYNLLFYKINYKTVQILK